VLLMTGLAVAGLLLWSLLDGHWTTNGYKTQIVTFLLLEGLVFVRLFFRVAWGDVMALARRVLPTSRLPRIAQRVLAAGPA